MKDWSQIREWWDEGVLLKEIARRAGCDASTLSHYAKAHGWPSRSRTLPPEIVEAVRVAYCDTEEEIPQMAERLGISIGVVTLLRRRHGWPLRLLPWNEERRREAQRLYREHQSLHVVSVLMGSNTSRVLDALRQEGEPLRSRAHYGEQNPAWNGGRTIDKTGYVLLRMPDHAEANSAGYVREHRVVMEKILGRALAVGEVVHHRNGIRDDNRPENLELYDSNGKHLAHELAGRCPNWSEEGKARILEAIRKPRKRSANLKPSSNDAEG